MFLPETGIPIRKSDLMRVIFAVALPDPLTVQKVMQKSFTIIFELSILCVTPYVEIIQTITVVLLFPVVLVDPYALSRVLTPE